MVGLSLAGPQSAAVAFAESSDSASTSETAGPASTATQRTARAPRPASARGAERDAGTDLWPAATILPSTASGEDAADPVSPPPGRGAQRTHATADIASADIASADIASADIASDRLPDHSPIAAGPVAPAGPAEPWTAATELPAPIAAAPEPVVVASPAAWEPAHNWSPSPVTAGLAVTPAAQPPVARAAAAPRGLAAGTMPIGAAAAASFADLVNGLFGPMQSLFEGAALMVRRSLFSEAPSVSPVQLTGPSQGPIADSFAVTATDSGPHLNLLSMSRPAANTAKVAVSQSATATPRLQFQFVYGTGSELMSAQARAALESAAARLAPYIVVSSPVVITYTVTARNSPLAPTLATASSSFIAPVAGFMKTVVQKKIQTGVDANGSAADGTIDVNVGKPWAYGDTVGSTQYDFQSTAMHEMLHTLGFVSYIKAPNANTGKLWTVYDSYVVNSARKKVISSTYTWNTAYNTNLTGGNGGLYFGGPNALSANNGIVSLYTPRTWKSGSSLSHLNDAVFFGSRRALMLAAVNTGPGLRTLSPVELGILKDIGYKVSSGSGTSALMVFGFFVTRRMRRED